MTTLTSYIIQRTDGTTLATLAPLTLNAISASITLIGQGSTAYGTAFNDNLVRMLEHFASTGTTPAAPLDGQLWYDRSSGAIKLYTADVWQPLASQSYVQSVVAAAAQTPVGVTAGTYPGATITVDALGRVTTASAGRTRLNGTTAFYVNGANPQAAVQNGNILTPFVTLQQCMNAIYETYDCNNNLIEVIVQPGTYVGMSIAGLPLGASMGGGTPIVINGNGTAPAAVTIIGNGSGGANPAFNIGNGASVTLNNMRIYNPTGYGILCSGLVAPVNMLFDSCNVQIATRGAGGVSFNGNPITFTGTNGYGLNIGGGSMDASGVKMTFLNTPSYATFAQVYGSGSNLYMSYGGSTPTSFVGSFTGQTFMVNTNAVISTNGAPQTFLPGSVAGTIASGGQYV